MELECGQLECGHIQKRLGISKESKIGYNLIWEEIERDFTSQNQRQEIKKIHKEIIRDLKSIRIPHSGLGN
jgi:hypothetical protein